MTPDQIKEEAIEAAFKMAHEKGYGVPHLIMRVAIDAYEKAMWRPIEEAHERAKADGAVLCACGYDNAEDVCDFHTAIVRRRLIAEAPKAWARVHGPNQFAIISGMDNCTKEEADEFAACYGIEIVRIALVEILEEGK